MPVTAWISEDSIPGRGQRTRQIARDSSMRASRQLEMLAPVAVTEAIMAPGRNARYVQGNSCYGNA